MGRPIPQDDEAAPEEMPSTSEAQEAGKEIAEGDEAQGETPQVAYSLEDYESALADDEPSQKVQGRINELVAERSRYRDDADRYARELQTMREDRARAQQVEQDKPRDFDAELKELKQKFSLGDIDQDAYLDARELLAEAKAEARMMERIRPVAETLEQERARIMREKVSSALDAEAEKTYAKYPFLNINSDEKNDSAISAVLAERDELIRAGIEPVKALRLAVSAIAPSYADDDAPAASNVDEIAARRQRAARKATAELNNSQPPNSARAGVGTKVAGKVTLTRSVEDFDKWEKMSHSDRENVAWAG